MLTFPKLSSLKKRITWYSIWHSIVSHQFYILKKLISLFNNNAMKVKVMKKLIFVLLASSVTPSLQALRVQRIRIQERRIPEQRQKFKEIVNVLRKLDQKTLATLYTNAHQQPNGFYIATKTDITHVTQQQATIIRDILIPQSFPLTPVLEG